MFAHATVDQKMVPPPDGGRRPPGRPARRRRAFLHAAVALAPLPPPSAASDGADASAGAEPEPRANEGPVADGTAVPSVVPTPNKGIRLSDRPNPSGQPRQRWRPVRVAWSRTSFSFFPLLILG